MLDMRSLRSNDKNSMVKKALGYASLFFSFSTMICCALPALMVSLGAGATLVSILSTVPQLIWFSEHKGWVFGVAGSLLLLNGVARLVIAPSCPTDPVLAAACQRAQKLSSLVFYGSLVLFHVGAFFAFFAPILFE
jgi:hypothetical protein